MRDWEDTLDTVTDCSIIWRSFGARGFEFDFRVYIDAIVSVVSAWHRGICREVGSIAQFENDGSIVARLYCLMITISQGRLNLGLGADCVITHAHTSNRLETTCALQIQKCVVFKYAGARVISRVSCHGFKLRLTCSRRVRCSLGSLNILLNNVT